jgi:hypothetical protein
MAKYNADRARAADCLQRARVALSDDERHSWLARAESWLVTARLYEQMAESEAWAQHRAVT